MAAGGKEQRRGVGGFLPAISCSRFFDTRPRAPLETFKARPLRLVLLPPARPPLSYSIGRAVAKMLSSAAATPPHQLRTATPPSYLSYSFPLPERRYVGLLACQRDPLLESLDAEVIRCDKVLRAPVAPAGKGKKAKAPVEELADEWEVELDDTGTLMRTQASRSRRRWVRS